MEAPRAAAHAPGHAHAHVDPTGKPNRTLLEMMAEARDRLQQMESSCRELLAGGTSTAQRVKLPAPRGLHAAAMPATSPSPSSSRQMELLRMQVDQLKTHLLEMIHEREEEDAIFQRAMAYDAAKGTANAVLHTLFDQAAAGKVAVLESWWETGVVPTRDGLKHWRLDLRDLRNERGETILHVAVSASMARQQRPKVMLVELLVDKVGFDANVRDAFGRTPLHVAAMAGFLDVVNALLERGADASLRDRSGRTALSVVRTLSRPPEDVVQVLAQAESVLAKQFQAPSDSISPQKAINSAQFLAGLARFVHPQRASAFSSQTQTLLNALLKAQEQETVAFDEELRESMPILFEDGRVHQLVRVDTLFQHGMFFDADAVRELQIEARAYDYSLVTPPCSSTAALAGATWAGLLLKLIQAFKLEMASVPTSDVARPSLPLVPQSAASETEESEGPMSPASQSAPPVRSPLYADLSSASSSKRQAWHYAVLFKASTHPLPGTLKIDANGTTAVCSEDVARFFPLEDRLLIGGVEYHGIDYDVSSCCIHLDHPFEGASGDNHKAYLAGSCSSLLPPYIATKRIWERLPGNQYEDHNSKEQELVMDYQFLDPDSDYEVAVKLGPISSAAQAREIVDEWKTQTRKLFEGRKCKSTAAACQHYCPQRSGHSLCVETMAIVGRDLAKTRLGRPNMSKPSQPRASVQKRQDLFLGKAPWPGSPKVTPPHDSASSVPSDASTVHASRTLEFED